jgi:hypothetical protein
MNRNPHAHGPTVLLKHLCAAGFKTSHYALEADGRINRTDKRMAGNLSSNMRQSSLVARVPDRNPEALREHRDDPQV